MRIYLGLIVMLFLASGCRYTHTIPSGSQRSNLAIDIVDNATFENELTPIVRREIIRQLAAKAPLNIVNQEVGVPVLSGKIVGYSRNSLRSNDDARSAEFRINITVDFIMHDINNKQIWRKTISGEETFAANGGAELAAQRAAVDDMVVKLIHALFPVW